MDWLAMTLLIHFSGGIESPVIMFFFLHIIIASIFFPPRTAFAFTLLAIALLSPPCGLEYFGALTSLCRLRGLLNTPFIPERAVYHALCCSSSPAPALMADLFDFDHSRASAPERRGNRSC